MHIYIYVCIYTYPIAYFFLIRVQFFQSVQNIEKGDFLERESQSGVRSLRGEFQYGLEISILS